MCEMLLTANVSAAALTHIVLASAYIMRAWCSWNEVYKRMLFRTSCCGSDMVWFCII